MCRVNYLSLNRLQNLHFVDADGTNATDDADVTGMQTMPMTTSE